MTSVRSAPVAAVVPESGGVMPGVTSPWPEMSSVPGDPGVSPMLSVTCVASVPGSEWSVVSASVMASAVLVGMAVLGVLIAPCGIAVVSVTFVMWTVCWSGSSKCLIEMWPG